MYIYYFIFSCREIRIYKLKMKTYFNEEWLTNVNYKLWVVKTKGKTIARCSLCKSDISLSNMGSSALDDHARDKKHSEKVKN